MCWRTEFSPVDVIVEVNVPGLFVMPAGPPMLNAADLISLGFAGVLTSSIAKFRSGDRGCASHAGPVGDAGNGHDGGRRFVITKADGTSAKALGETLPH